MKSSLLLLALLYVSCTTIGGDSPERRLRYYVAMPTERGDVIAQGSLDGVDYRNLLRGAVAKDAASLRGIFRYTANGHLMGEGANTNCEILLHLLHTWGDAAFAHVLVAEPLKTRTRVISAIDYSWPYPGWRPTEFPLTYRLAGHDISYRQ